MIEVRLAKNGEIEQQKAIWKLCFGDSDAYIDFYYANRYREEDTVVLLSENKIAAMLTIVPVSVVAPDCDSHESAMLYGIATHPQYRNRGFATRMMAFSYQHLQAKGIELVMLVPANDGLFKFYQKMNYQKAFYLREAELTQTEIEGFAADAASACVVSPASPAEYNRRRNALLQGRFYVSYTDADIEFQKKMSLYSQADIYLIDAGGVYGCAAVERESPERLLLKELLLPEAYLYVLLQQLLLLLPAKEVTLRLPAFSGGCRGGKVRPFGMLRGLGKAEPIKMAAISEEASYLGLAFD